MGGCQSCHPYTVGQRWKSSGHNIPVVVDEYSRFPAVKILTSTTANATIPLGLLDKIFAEHGIPEVVKSDNGPPFQSEDFANFAKYPNFTHQRITPLWPDANGKAERSCAHSRRQSKPLRPTAGHGDKAYGPSYATTVQHLILQPVFHLQLHYTAGRFAQPFPNSLQH